MADNYVRRVHSILTAADYARYGDSSGTVEYLVVTKDDIGESRLAIDAMTTSTTVKGTMIYHEAVCLQPGVLIMRTTFCYGSWFFHHGQYVIGCQGWTEHVLFPKPPPVPAPQLNQQTSSGREEQENTLTSRSSRSDQGRLPTLKPSTV